MSSAKKQVKELVKAAEAQGWRVEQTRNGHFMFYAPDGENMVAVPGTPSDHRSLRNCMAIMKRLGLKL